MFTIPLKATSTFFRIYNNRPFVRLPMEWFPRQHVLMPIPWGKRRVWLFINALIIFYLVLSLAELLKLLIGKTLLSPEELVFSLTYPDCFAFSALLAYLTKGEYMERVSFGLLNLDEIKRRFLAGSYNYLGCNI